MVTRLSTVPVRETWVLGSAAKGDSSVLSTPCPGSGRPQAPVGA